VLLAQSMPVSSKNAKLKSFHSFLKLIPSLKTWSSGPGFFTARPDYNMNTIDIGKVFSQHCDGFVQSDLKFGMLETLLKTAVGGKTARAFGVPADTGPRTGQ
jgi:hypothetical protein